MIIAVTGTNADAARIARAAAEAHERQHLSHVTINGVRFNLTETGYCARFVRLVHEAVLRLPPWGWAWNAANARYMEAKLKANGLGVEEPEPGDVVAFNRRTGRYGHIGIFLGDGLFAENTSSKVRGPGTVISDLSRMASRISGYYRPLRSAREASLPETVKVVRLANMVTEAHLSDGHYRVTVRDCADLTDCELVTKHVREQRKLYLWPRAWGPVPHSDM